MFKEILTKEQIELIPLIKQFKCDYYLVGGTAIALQIGHRRSVDFDLFTKENLKRKQIKKIIEASGYTTTDVLYEAAEQVHIIINSVKITFFQFPHELKPDIDFDDVIKMPSLLHLAAMKAYALGGRAKWKDYVDLFFIIKYHNIPLNEIVFKAKELFNNFFNDKLFREQLAYFEDIDYSEDVEYISKEISKEEVKSFLIDSAIEKF
jgi:hypothetical protein